MKALGLALIAGLLFALALPPFNQEWLGWFALAPLFLAADGRRPLEAVGLGLIAGLTGGLVHARWHSDSGALLLGYLPFLWLAVFFGVVAVAGRTARMRGWGGLPWIGFVACVGVTAEWLTTFSPLPLNVALCQNRNLPLIQLASIRGIWGVSFLIWAVNALLALAVGATSPGAGRPSFRSGLLEPQWPKCPAERREPTQRRRATLVADSADDGSAETARVGGCRLVGRRQARLSEKRAQ